MSDEPAYQDALREAIAKAGQLLPGLHIATVWHDDWCALLASKGPCNCSPEVTLEEVTE